MPAKVPFSPQNPVTSALKICFHLPSCMPAVSTGTLISVCECSVDKPSVYNQAAPICSFIPIWTWRGSWRITRSPKLGSNRWDADKRFSAWMRVRVLFCLHHFWEGGVVPLFHLFQSAPAAMQNVHNTKAVSLPDLEGR